MNQKMRKIYSFAVAAVAMFAAMSCAKEIVQDNQQAGMPDNDALTFVARVDGADDASETKSVLDGLKSYWDGEEKIWILDPRNETNDEGPFLNTGWKKGFTAVTEKSQTATFVEDDNTTSFEGETLMAVYPAGPAGSACWEGGESSVTGMWLSNEQTAVAWSYDPNAHIAIAQTAAASNVLKFKNVSSLLKFQVAHNTKGEVKFISYKPAEGDAPRIAGNFSVNYNGGEPVVTPENDKMTFDAVALKGEFAEGSDYHMAILPANLAYGFAVQINGYTVKELKGDSLTDEKFVNLLDRKRNMILNLGTVSLNFGVCGTHTDWKSDTPMSYDETTGLYVAQDVVFAGEDNKFKIRACGMWASSVGTGGAIVVNSENQGSLDGGDSSIAAGTYDIWFDAGQKIIYAMSDGKTPGDIEYTSVVYLKPNANWKQDGARFAAYFYREGMQWVDMTDEDGDEIYECEVPEGTSRVIFCRMNPDVAENRWNSETDTEETKALWNQSADLKLPIDDTNCYTIAEDAWDKGEGSWSTLEDAKGTPEEPEVTPGEASEWAIIGDFNGSGQWVEKQMLTTVTSKVFVIEDVVIPTDYFSILVKKYNDSDWTVKYGGGIVYFNPGNSMKVYTNGSDICITKAGTYDFYFDLANTMLYVVNPGVDYTTVSEQTVDGEEPKQEEPEVTSNVLYLTFSGVWQNGDERFAAYFFNNSGGNTWVSMKDSDSDGIYEVNIPEGYNLGDNVIFCRMKGTSTSNGWTNKWNQTADLTIPTDGKNLYTVKSWDNSPNTHWSTK